MTAPDRDLVAAIRAELAAIDPSRACDRAAESAGLGRGLSTREAAVARLAVRLGRGTTRPTAHGPGSRRPKHVHLLDSALDSARDEPAAPGEDGGRGDRRRGEADGDAAPVRGNRDEPGMPSGIGHEVGAPAFDWDAAPDHCRWSYLRGRFLARGSLSLSASRAHLEFVVTPDEAPVLAARLLSVDLPASWRIRRNRGVVTWKSADTIGTFLRRIGAGASLLEFESRRVSRALRGDLNRVINAESANLQRVVLAAGRQLAAIEELEADGRLAGQPYTVRLVADARRETPEATLTELAERLALHRSAIQRALERLERLALHPDEGIGQRGAERPGRRGSSAPRSGASARQTSQVPLASFRP